MISFIPNEANHTATGFPSPADDFIEQGLSLDRLIVIHPASTFFMRAIGRSNFDIYENDLLVIDRSIKPRENALSVFVIDGELTIKPFFEGNYQNKSLELWGVITHIIRGL